tara:strand:- start:76820 stop:77380 length:561 start_codon:yes stop_codon:yes gene_type:complete
MNLKLTKKLKVLLLIIIVLFASIIYNIVSGNRVPVAGHAIAFFRPIFNNYKIIDLNEVIKTQDKVTFKELPDKVKNSLMDYREDINRPVSKKKFDYTIPFINLGTAYNLNYEQSNFIYSDYYLFYIYGQDYQAILINHKYYINITKYGNPIFYNDNIYIYSDESGRAFTDQDAVYCIVDLDELINI